MNRSKLILAGSLAFLALVLVLQNTEVVSVRLFLWDLQMSRVVLILLAGAIGFGFGYLAVSYVGAGKGT